MPTASESGANPRGAPKVRSPEPYFWVKSQAGEEKACQWAFSSREASTLTAPGEVWGSMPSDGGSTPPASTKINNSTMFKDYEIPLLRRTLIRKIIRYRQVNINLEVKLVKANKNFLLKLIEEIPESQIEEVIDFILFLKHEQDKKLLSDLVFPSESSIDFWNNDIEDEVWNNV